MYQSPIEAIVNDMELSFEKEVCKAVQKVGINVDAEELRKALLFDREQYEKGYRDGLNDAVRHGRWIYKGARGRFPVCECSVCGNAENADWAILGDNVNYCPNCGAKMERSEE